VNGFKEGKGILLFSNGASARGNFHNGLLHKNGVYTGAPTDYISYYEGDWHHGRLHGKGYLRFANGDSYKGGFKNGSYHGTGTYTYANGVSLTCKWVMGVKDSKVTIVNKEQAFNGVIGQDVNGYNLVVPLSSGFEMSLPPSLPLSPILYDCDSSRIR